MDGLAGGRTVVAVSSALILVGAFLAVAFQTVAFQTFLYGRSPVDNSAAAVQPCPSVSPAGPGVPIVRLLKPATQTWPCAVHTLPATLPDGTAYQAAAVVGPYEYVVTTGPVAGPTGVAVFHTQERSARWISRRGSTDRVLHVPRVDGDLVAFATTGPNGAIVVWSASISTDALRQFPVESGVIGPPRPVEGRLVWTAYRDSAHAVATGVWSASATGGPALELPGLAGYELVTGAWARQVTPASPSGDDLVNVQTGQRLPIRYGGEKHDQRLDCTPFWCTGPGVERHAYAMLPVNGGHGPTELDLRYLLVAGGRVAVTRIDEDRTNGPGIAVWNPTTGVSARLDDRYALPADPSTDLTVLTTRPDGQHPLEVFDLGAVA